MLRPMLHLPSTARSAVHGDAAATAGNFGVFMARQLLTAGLILSFSACGGSAAGSGVSSSALPVAVVQAPNAELAASSAASSPAAAPTASATPGSVSFTAEPAPLAVAPGSTSTTALKGVVAEGDSISVFWGGNYTGIFAAAHPKIAFTGLAVGGAGISDVGGGNGLVQRLPKLIALKPAVVTILIGANDLPGKRYASTWAWLDALWAYVAEVKATGAKVIVGTVLPICLPQYPDLTASQKERRAVANDAIRAEVGKRIDGVFDLARDPTVGNDEAACDTTIYSDGLHPTAKGQEAIAKVYSTAVEAALR